MLACHNMSLGGFWMFTLVAKHWAEDSFWPQSTWSLMFSPWTHHEDGRSNIFLPVLSSVTPSSHVDWPQSWPDQGWHVSLFSHPNNCATLPHFHDSIRVGSGHWKHVWSAHKPYYVPPLLRITWRDVSQELRALVRTARDWPAVQWWWAESTGGGAHRGNLWPVPDH